MKVLKVQKFKAERMRGIKRWRYIHNRCYLLFEGEYPKDHIRYQHIKVEDPWHWEQFEAEIARSQNQIPTEK